MIFTSLDKYRDTGLLFLRLGIGVMFVIHGWEHFFGGPMRWESLGMAMSAIGVTYLHTFWGFMAAITELGGGLMLTIGFYHRPVCMLLAFTMYVAAMKHMVNGDGFAKISHPVELMILFMAWILIGPGKFSFDGKSHGGPG